MTLEETHDNALDYTNFLIESLLLMDSAEELGELANRLSSQYRRLAVFNLLIDADVDSFFHHLIDSAQTRRYFLERCVQEETPSLPACRSSAIDAFFDAVAAGRLHLAAAIARSSPRVHLVDVEYEEDFAYAHFLHALVQADTPRDETVQQALRQFTDSPDGRDSRLDVCRALASQDQSLFDDAFLQLLADHEGYIEYGRDAIYRFGDDQLVCIEGLAILRLADRSGLKTETEYRFCPGLARGTMQTPYVPGGFPNLSLPS